MLLVSNGPAGPPSAAADEPMASGHARPPGGTTLSLDLVLRQVADANPMLAARRAMTEAARKRIAPAGAWESPMLEAGVVNVPTSGRFDMDEMTMKMVGFVQRVPLFGANGLRRDAAREAAEAEGAAALRAHYEAYGAAIEAYADAYFALRRAEEAEHHRGTMERLLESARARYRSGNGRLDEMLRAESERARVIADIVRYRAAAERAWARLDAIRGRDPGAPPADLEPPPALAVPEVEGSWALAAQEGHPRLAEAEARERGYAFSARASRRMSWPDLEVRASYGFRGADRMGMDWDNMFSAGVGFMLPIFAGQRERAMGAEFDAMARAAAAERREAELDLAREAHALHAEARAAARTVTLLADTVVVTQERAVEAAWSAYAAGAVDLYRVFDAAHALYGEDLSLLDARNELSRVQGRLVALTGRGDLAGIQLPAFRRDER
jgi:outer membrane protein TolC